MTQRGRFLLLYSAAWLPFAAMYAFSVAQRSTTQDGILAGVTTAAIAGVLGLGVRALLARLRARPRPRAALIAAHVGMGAAFSVLWAGSVAAMVRFGAPAAIWRDFAEQALTWQFITGILLYGLLAAVFEAFENARRLREQEQLAARAEALRVHAELQALRAQLNPHFLFNTLHSITALVRSDSRAAEQALERFGLLMRRVLELNREQREEIPLAEELEFVRAFLALESMRLGDRLRVVEQIDPDALECHVLSFSLQPLVENAIAHGIAPLARGGTIRLCAELGEDALVLEVADDGAGAPAARLATSDGVGLQAVRQRLIARFGDAARVSVATAPGEGCRVRLTMPVVLRPLSARLTMEAAVPR